MKNKQPKIQNSIIYSGPSLIDGKPIIVVAIIKSGNKKTGNMLQTHIIRADISPTMASKTGEDYSICGNCKHRGESTVNPERKIAVNRSCYVNLAQGPTQVFKAYKAGKYPTVTDPARIAQIGAGRMIRLGTYGDPAAVPSAVWNALLSQAEGHTGYTHQHDKAPDYTRMMYSADTPEEATQAHNKGYRTFRVISLKQWHNAQSQNKSALLSNEILCPASKEAEVKTTCNNCKLCSGNNIKAKSIAIVAHGIGKNSIK